MCHSGRGFPKGQRSPEHARGIGFNDTVGTRGPETADPRFWVPGFRCTYRSYKTMRRRSECR
nr:MAG TPA: hypothetical protein [Caudoviricetes sp.]